MTTDELRAPGTDDDPLPRTRTGALDWATFLGGLWVYATTGVAAALAGVLVLLGLGRVRR